MSDPAEAPAAAVAPTAGRLLREAREKQGLHIAALAAAIKVTPRKLELLESDRFDELPDATFTRALAQTVCRALKTDPAAVMRLLPPPSGHRLEQVGGGLNAPFRERPGALVQRDWAQFAANPVFWIVAAIVVATLALYLLPARVTSLALGRQPAASAPAVHGAVEPGMPPEAVDSGASSVLVAGASEPASDAASAAPVVSMVPVVVAASGNVAASEPAATAVVPPTATAPAPVASAAPVVAAAPASASLAPGTLPAGMLQLQATAASWIEVTDSRGKSLVSRLVKPGEAIGVDGVPPLKVRIGNASGTHVLFRGQPTELQAFTRDNVARLELR